MPSNSYIAPTTQPNLDFARCGSLAKFNSDSNLVLASYFNGYVYVYNGNELTPVSGSVPNIFGSWTNGALGGLPPNAYTNGGAHFVSGAVGSINWELDAYSGIYGLQIQTINGGLFVFNSLLPGLNYTVTGTETFTSYFKLLDNIPQQIELSFYANGSWAHRVYLGTDYFNFGSSVNIGNVPTSLNQWFSFTFTAADLGLSIGDVITGLGWGVWQYNTTSTVIFSDITTFTNTSNSVPDVSGYIDCTSNGLGEYYILPFYGSLYAGENGGVISPIATLSSGSISYTGIRYNSQPYILGQDGTIYNYAAGTVSTVTPPPSGITAPARFLATDSSDNLYTIFAASNDLATFNLATSGWTLISSPFNTSLDTVNYTGSLVSVGGSNAISFTTSGVTDATVSSLSDQILISNGTNIDVWNFTTGGWSHYSSISGAGDPTSIACNSNNNALVSNPTANIIQQLNYSAGVWLSANLSITDPTAIAIQPNGLIALVCQSSQNTVSVLNNARGTWSIGSTISTGTNPNLIAINASGTNAIVGVTSGITFLNYNGVDWAFVSTTTLSSTPVQVALDSNNPNNSFLYVATNDGTNTTITVYNEAIQLGSYSFVGITSSLLVVDYQIFAILTNGDVNIGICVTTGQTSNLTQNSIAPLSNTVAIWYPNYILLSGGSNMNEYYIVEPFNIATTSDSIVATLSGATWLTCDLQNRNRISSITSDVSGRVLATTTDNEIYRIIDYTTIDTGYPYLLSPPIGQLTNTAIGASRSTYFNNALFSSSSLYGGLIDITINGVITEVGVSINSSSSSGTAATFVISKPTGVVSGDVLIATISANSDGGSLAITPPAGWVSIDAATVGTTPNLVAQFNNYYLVAGNNEPSSYNWTITVASASTISYNGAIAAYSRVSTSSPINAHSIIASNIGGSTATSITTTVNACTLLAVFNDQTGSNVYTNPNGFIQRWNNQNLVNDQSQAGFDKSNVGIEATGNIVSSGPAGTDYTCSFLIALTPAT